MVNGSLWLKLLVFILVFNWGNVDAIFAGTEQEIARKTALFEAKCGPPCHSLELSLKREDTRAGWANIVGIMKQYADNSNKIRISESEVPQIVDYLTDIAGPEMKKSRLRNIRIFFGASFILLLILGIVIYVRVKQVKQSQK